MYKPFLSVAVAGFLALSSCASIKKAFTDEKGEKKPSRPLTLVTGNTTHPQKEKQALSLEEFLDVFYISTCLPSQRTEEQLTRKAEALYSFMGREEFETQQYLQDPIFEAAENLIKVNFLRGDEKPILYLSLELKLQQGIAPFSQVEEARGIQRKFKRGKEASTTIMDFKLLASQGPQVKITETYNRATGGGVMTLTKEDIRMLEDIAESSLYVIQGLGTQETVSRGK